MRYIFFMIFFLSSVGGNALYNSGEYLYFAKACSSCHGPSAEGSSSSPRLANKPQKYLIKKLRYFKKGKVVSQSQEMMSQFIKILSDKEIKALSIFLSQYKKITLPDVSDDILGGFGS